jgi:hypothetical protein
MPLEQINPQSETSAATAYRFARRAWPDAVTFREAIQSPVSTIGDTDLRMASIALNRMGMPLSYSGRFAIVFRLTTGSGERWAFRCFTSPGEEGTGQARALRYATIERHTALLPNTFVPFRYREQGIRVGGEWYPALIMRWAPGKPLGRWIEEHIDEPDRLLRLCGSLSGLLERLEAAGIAHGDWQHDNLIVSDDGSLVTLVDYDGMFVPEFAGQPCPEMGHPNYQHPARSAEHFGPGLDRFACLAVETALLALCRAPDLWARFSDGESVLFKFHDFLDPERSPAFAAVEAVAVAHHDELLAESLARLKDACLAGAQSTLLPAIAAAEPPPPIFSQEETALQPADMPGVGPASRWWQIPEAAPAAKVWWSESAARTGRAAPRRSQTILRPTFTYLPRLTSEAALRAERKHLLRWRMATSAILMMILFVMYDWIVRSGIPPLYLLWVLNLYSLGYGQWPRQQLSRELNAEIAKMDSLIRERTQRMAAVAWAHPVSIDLYVNGVLRDTPLARVSTDLAFSAAEKRYLQNAGIDNALVLKNNLHRLRLGNIGDERQLSVYRYLQEIEAHAADDFRRLTPKDRSVSAEADRLRHEIAEFERHAAILKEERALFPEAGFLSYLRHLAGMPDRGIAGPGVAAP